MSGTVTDLGSTTVGGCIPTTVSAFASVEGNLTSQLVAAGGLSTALDVGPPSVATATQIGATATLQAMASVTGPYFGLAIDANLGTIAAIKAQLAALGGIIAALGQAGVFLYQYNGTADSLGSTLQTVLASGLPGGAGTDHVDALCLIASTPAAWAAMQTVMKTG